MRQFLAATAVLALTSGCAEAIPIDWDPHFNAEGFQTYALDCAAIDDRPVLPEVTASLGVPSAPTLVRKIVIDETLNDLMRNAIMVAIATVEEATLGHVKYEPSIGPVICGDQDVFFGAPPGECMMKCDGSACYVGWSFGHNSYAIRNDRADAWEAYWIAVHELSHGLGLPHSDGFMNSYAPRDTYFLNHHWREIARKNGWYRSDLRGGRWDAPYEEAVNF